MPMVPLFSTFLEMGLAETRTLTVSGRDDLPNGQYAFVEFYCDEAGCDCSRVLIRVLSRSTGSKIWATITFGWKDVDFYEARLHDRETAIICKGPSLDPICEQSPNSAVLLELFRVMVMDAAYVERLKEHYRLFRQSLAGTRRPARAKKAKPTARKRKR
jgi:hypothetical protein